MKDIKPIAIQFNMLQHQVAAVVTQALSTCTINPNILNILNYLNPLRPIWIYITCIAWLNFLNLLNLLNNLSPLDHCVHQRKSTAAGLHGHCMCTTTDPI